jgi:ferredoxin
MQTKRRYAGGGRTRGKGPGMGRNRGRGRRHNPLSHGPVGLTPVSPEHEVEILTARAEAIKAQMRAINARIRAMQHKKEAPAASVAKGEVPGETPADVKDKRIVAIVFMQKCAVCGLCAETCPEEAITLNDIVVIDQRKCTGCGLCVDNCPNGAISLTTV